MYKYTDLDKVCTHCNERFGEHFGPGRGHHYCDLKMYEFYENNPKIPVNIKFTFVYSGACMFRFDKKPTKLKIDPNALFKLRCSGREKT